MSADPSNKSPHTSAPGPTTAPLLHLVALLRPERTDVFAVIVFSATIGLLMLATPVAVQTIVNSVALGGLVQPLVVIVALLMLALSLAAVLFGLQIWTIELLQRRLFVRLVASISGRLPHVSLAEYDTGHGPEIVNRFFDVITIQKAAPKLLIDAIGMFLGVFIGLMVLAFYHPILLAFGVLLFVTIMFIVLGPHRRAEHSAIDESSAKYAVASWLEEIARSPRTFRIGGSRRWNVEMTDALTRRWVQTRSDHFRILFSQILGALLLQVVASTALLGIGGLLVMNGSLTLGQLVAAELIVTGVVSSIANVGKYLETWYDLIAAVHKVGQLLDVDVEQSGGQTTMAASTGGASLEFVNVSLKGTRGHTLFSGVELSIQPGERIGITGPRSVGKSSLVELLWRLGEPTTGSIRLDDHDLRDLDLDGLRTQVAIISAIEIVHGTVRENVSLQRDGVTEDDVRSAIESVGLEDAVSELPNRLETTLHPHGRILSSGEVRRLMLARAIAGSPSLLAVDNIFDGSPPEVHEVVFDMLFDEARPWTLLVVSDLPEVLERCDRVLHLSRSHSATSTSSSSSSSSSIDMAEE